MKKPVLTVRFFPNALFRASVEPICASFRIAMFSLDEKISLVLAFQDCTHPDIHCGEASAHVEEWSEYRKGTRAVWLCYQPRKVPTGAKQVMYLPVVVCFEGTQIHSRCISILFSNHDECSTSQKLMRYHLGFLWAHSHKVISGYPLANPILRCMAPRPATVNYRSGVYRLWA